MKPRLFLYCQHSMGLGHLVRSWAIADALSSAFDVVFVSGGAPPAGMAPPPRVKMVCLPPLTQTTAGELVSESGERVELVQERRRQLLSDAFVATDPAVVVIELFPFGRAKFASEIVPILDYARTLRPRPTIVCSVRDLLAGGRTKQQQHDDRARALADRYFDAVLVHADPRLARLEETFKPQAPLRVPVFYTGFVSPQASTPKPALEAGRAGIVVTAGGGRVGGPLFRAAVEAHLLTPPAGRLPMRVITGPFLPPDEHHALVARAGTCPDLTVCGAVPSLRPWLASCAVSVSQCGYNTALDLVQLGVAALVVPFAEGREDEQRARARRLEAMGAVRVLDPDALSPERLASELIAMRRFTPAPFALDTDGAGETLRIVTNLRHPELAGVVPAAECA